MAEEAAVPPGLWERIDRRVAAGLAKFAQSGFLRNARITGGAGLTVSDGGALRLQTVDGATSFYVGGGTPALADGSSQPLTIMYRADGSLAFAIYDPFPLLDGFQQALYFYDRGGNQIVADDLITGQGLKRPYLPMGFSRARYADWSVSTVSATFETLFECQFYKQHPNVVIRVKVSNDTAAATGELRVMVDGVQLGTTQATGFVQSTKDFSGSVAGTHMEYKTLSVQARLNTGTGAVRVEPVTAIGMESA